MVARFEQRKLSLSSGRSFADGSEREPWHWEPDDVGLVCHGALRSRYQSRSIYRVGVVGDAPSFASMSNSIFVR
jgi:hypothetical protein